jgi:hypothetical protein
MGHAHPSTPAERAQWAAYMLAHHDEYGIVMQLSRQHQVSRPTLYAWRAHAERVLAAVFAAPPATERPAPISPRQVLTLWIAHASDRGIQHATAELLHRGVSLDTITMILAEAAQRAQTWMQTHVPPSVRALALDEIYANNRRGAYLNVVDVHSGAVWASEGPLAVDCESWTLVLWELQAPELHWDRVALDGGAAMLAACRSVTPAVQVQGDVWHVLHSCAQVQARLDRVIARLEAQTPVVVRQAGRLAAGQRPRGPKPKTDVAAHAHDLAAAVRVAEGVRYLTQELHQLLAVVVLDQRGLLDAAQRQAELDATLTLLAEIADAAPAAQQEIVRRLHATLSAVLPQLLTFVAQLDQVQHDLRAVLDAEEQALLAWAWLRRESLGWTSAELLAAIPTDWRSAARVLLAAWDDAVRVSSAVERWHSIMRPHLAVHRVLSTGLLALLAVWHNHRVFSRGVHKGKNRLHLSGIADAPTDWLTALGYPPIEATTLPATATPEVALAA